MSHQRQGVVFDPFEVFPDLPGVNLPGFGERYTLLDAVEELDTELGFKRRDLPTNRALRQGQFFRRTGEALVTRRRLESNQKLRTRYLSSHDVYSEIAQYYDYTAFAVSPKQSENRTDTGIL
jgi:hypothetical protein